MAGQVISKVATTDGGTHLISPSFYCTCKVAASAVDKIAIINDPAITDTITLINGLTIYVKFTNSNSASNPTITVYNNSGTAASPTQGSTTLIAQKSIMRYGTATPGTMDATSWHSGSIVALTYDGTNGVINNGLNNDTTYTSVTLGNGYAILSTTTPTQVAKSAALSGYVLSTGGRVSVYCGYANTTPAPTMNINTRGNKAIYINNAASSASNPVLWDAGDILELVYDGTRYQLVSKSATNAEIDAIINS